jgi:hypothetical protein
MTRVIELKCAYRSREQRQIDHGKQSKNPWQKKHDGTDCIGPTASQHQRREYDELERERHHRPSKEPSRESPPAAAEQYPSSTNDYDLLHVMLRPVNVEPLETIAMRVAADRSHVRWARPCRGRDAPCAAIPQPSEAVAPRQRRRIHTFYDFFGRISGGRPRSS